MGKKIEDYLHLYLGCSIVHGALKNNRILTARWMSSLIEKHIEVKPILRPLSDMSQDEIVNLFLLKGLDYSKDYTRTSIQDNFIQIEYKCAGELLSDYITAPIFRPEQFQYLLSKHFDLFGLIEAGLAIDKTTLK